MITSVNRRLMQFVVTVPEIPVGVIYKLAGVRLLVGIADVLLHPVGKAGVIVMVAIKPENALTGPMSIKSSIVVLLKRLRRRAGQLPQPLRLLPGDIRIEGENGSFYFPVTSSILVSVILTIILNLISRLLKK